MFYHLVFFFLRISNTNIRMQKECKKNVDNKNDELCHNTIKMLRVKWLKEELH